MELRRPVSCQPEHQSVNYQTEKPKSNKNERRQNKLQKRFQENVQQSDDGGGFCQVKKLASERNAGNVVDGYLQTNEISNQPQKDFRNRRHKVK